MLRILGVIAVLSILFTLLTVGKLLPARDAAIAVCLALIALVVFPKQTDKVLRYLAAAVAVYVLIVHLGARPAIGTLAAFLVLLLAFYMILRPFRRKGAD